MSPLALPVVGLERPLHVVLSIVPVLTLGARRDETIRVTESIVSCQRETASTPCVRQRLYASVRGLRTANSVEPSHDARPGFSTTVEISV